MGIIKIWLGKEKGLLKFESLKFFCWLKFESKPALLLTLDNVFDISSYREYRSVSRIAKTSSKDSNRADIGINKN